MGRVVRRDLYGNPVPVASVPPAVCSKFIVSCVAINGARDSGKYSFCMVYTIHGTHIHVLHASDPQLCGI